MTEEHFNSLGLTLKQYHGLDKEEKYSYNEEYFYNPFDERIRRGELPLITMGSLQLDGPWEDGGHFITNPFNCDFMYKIEVKSNEVVRAWKLIDHSEWVVMPKPWGSGVGENN